MDLSDDIIVLNMPDLDRIEDFDDKNCFVWAGFVKPGQHTIVIKGVEG